MYDHEEHNVRSRQNTFACDIRPGAIASAPTRGHYRSGGIGDMEQITDKESKILAVGKPSAMLIMKVERLKVAMRVRMLEGTRD